jgi:hypothetical protein
MERQQVGEDGERARCRREKPDGLLFPEPEIRQITSEDLGASRCDKEHYRLERGHGDETSLD